MGVVTVEFCDNLDSSPALAVADDLLAVSCWEEALAVVLHLHRVVCDVCVPLGTSHLKTWMFRLKIYIIWKPLFYQIPALLRSRITVSNSETDFW